MPYVYSPILNTGELYEEPFLEYIRSLDLRGVYLDIGARIWAPIPCGSPRCVRQPVSTPSSR